MTEAAISTQVATQVSTDNSSLVHVPFLETKEIDENDILYTLTPYLFEQIWTVSPKKHQDGDSCLLLVSSNAEANECVKVEVKDIRDLTPDEKSDDFKSLVASAEEGNMPLHEFVLFAAIVLDQKRKFRFSCIIDLPHLEFFTSPDKEKCFAFLEGLDLCRQSEEECEEWKHMMKNMNVHLCLIKDGAVQLQVDEKVKKTYWIPVPCSSFLIKKGAAQKYVAWFYFLDAVFRFLNKQKEEIVLVHMFDKNRNVWYLLVPSLSFIHLEGGQGTSSICFS